MLDNRTLLIIQLLIPFSFMVIQLVQFGWSERQAVKANILANFFQLVGYLLILFNSFYPKFYCISFSNLSLVTSSVLMLVTTFKLFRVRIPIKRFVSLGVLSFILLFLTWVNLFGISKTLITTAGLGFLFLFGIVYLYFETPADSRMLLRVFSIVFFLISSAFFFRFVFSIKFLNGCDSILSNDWISSSYIMVVSLLILVWNYTIQMKRNSDFKLELESNVSDLLKTQENLSILNYFLHNNKVNNSLDDLYPKIFDQIYEYFAVEKAALFLYINKNLIPVYQRGVDSEEFPVLLDLNPETSVSYDAYLNNRISQVNTNDLPDGDLKKFLTKKEIEGIISFPLYTNGVGIGVLSVGIFSNSSILDVDQDIFLSICTQIAGVIHSSMIYSELLDTQKKLIKMASTDPLTGIYNRREFYKLFRKEFSSAKRHKDVLSLFILDLDDFKNVNDTYGHDVGDVVLISVVNKIKSLLRENDLFARYGGEEFIGVLLRSDRAGAEKKLEVLIEEVEKLQIEGHEDLKITISMGCYHFHQELEDMEYMIKRADIALYKAKKLGKNRLCLG